LKALHLYEVDHSTVWLAAANALFYLARSRAKLFDVPPDNWALIATAKLLPYYAQSATPSSRKELIQHAIQVCRAPMKNQLRSPAIPGLDGSFDRTGRTAPTATRMEGLLAVLEFLPNGSLRRQVRETDGRRLEVPVVLPHSEMLGKHFECFCPKSSVDRS
jgi:hypothetical protein